MRPGCVEFELLARSVHLGGADLRAAAGPWVAELERAGACSREYLLPGHKPASLRMAGLLANGSGVLHNWSSCRRRDWSPPTHGVLPAAWRADRARISGRATRSGPARYGISVLPVTTLPPPPRLSLLCSAR